MNTLVTKVCLRCWGFVENPDKDLDVFLKKSYTTQTDINYHLGGIGVYGNVQEGKGRKPHINPDPCVQTR